MAALAGSLFSREFYSGRLGNCRNGVLYSPDSSVPRTYYCRMRGIDITCPEIQQPAYVYWTVEGDPDWDASELSAGDLPCGTDPSTDVEDIQLTARWEKG